jgi:hypothetical protein
MILLGRAAATIPPTAWRMVSSEINPAVLLTRPGNSPGCRVDADQCRIERPTRQLSEDAMSIPRDAAVDDAKLVDPDARPVGPIHLGVILDEEFLAPLGLSAYALARAISVPRNRITGIIRGGRVVTAERGGAATPKEDQHDQPRPRLEQRAPAPR